MGDNTDLLVLLCYHASPVPMPIYLQPRPRVQRETAFCDIHKLQNHLGDDVCQNILFIHAFFGCDTTSQLLGFVKDITLKIFENSESLRNAASVFNMPKDNASK